MILLVTNRQDYTADFLILELRKREIDYVRFNTEDFPQHVKLTWMMNQDGLSGHFLFPKKLVHFKDIRSIWYRRPVPPVASTQIKDSAAANFARAESQEALDAVWRCLDCFWVSHPDHLRAAEFKLYQLATAARIGFSIPPTIVTSEAEAAKAFYKAQEGVVAYKPLKHGRLVRDQAVSLIYTNHISREQALALDKVQYAPSLLQRYLPKQCDIRVTVIGSKVFAVSIDSQRWPESVHDWRRGENTRLRHESHELPVEIKAQCVKLVRSLGLEFGAIDLVLTPSDQYVFLEINPNGQWAWVQQLRPQIPLRETLTDLLVKGKQSNNDYP